MKSDPMIVYEGFRQKLDAMLLQNKTEWEVIGMYFDFVLNVQYVCFVIEPRK